MKVVLEIPLLTLSDANIWFIEKELVWRSYMTAKILLTIIRVELIGEREFTVVALDKNAKIVVIHIAAPKTMSIYPNQKIPITLLQNS